MRTNLWNLAVYCVIVPLFCFVAIFQWRASWSTLDVETNLNFCVPFQLQNFSNRIDARAYTSSWDEKSPIDRKGRSALQWRDELLRVNDREFSGMSVYLQELGKVWYQPSPGDARWRPFNVTLRSNGTQIHKVFFQFPHCTCGVPTLWQAASIWIAPPAFCVLLGFATVALRPRSMLSWGFLGLVLALSQLSPASDSYTGFQQTITPMQWTGWFRIPAVGYQSFVRHVWPAAFLICAAHFLSARNSVRRALLLASIFFFGFAAMVSALAIAWSEDFRGFVFLFEAVHSHSSEVMVTAMAGVAGLCWAINRSYGLATFGIGFSAVTALLLSPEPITKGVWNTYSDNSRRFDATIPKFHNTPELLILLFTAGCIVAGLIALRRELKTYEIASFVLLMPLAIDLGARFGRYWYPLGMGFFEYWVWFALATSGIGLFGVAWAVIRRSRSLLEPR